jgi:hypothetical protein
MSTAHGSWYTEQNLTKKVKMMSKYYGVQVCKLTFLKVDENGDSIDDKEYEYTGDHSSFCEGIDEAYLEEVIISFFIILKIMILNRPMLKAL